MKTTYTYDAQGRMATETDARNGASTYAYNNADQVDSVTTPPPGGSGSGLTTLTYYNAMLQPTNVVYPDSTSVTTAYELDGSFAASSGSRTYPVGYSYDGQGRTLTMTNWGQAGAEVTTWKYDGARGWMTNKLDNSGYGPSYTFTSTGQVATRIWARSPTITTTYGYDAAGKLATVVYNDGTPSVTNTYDRLGRRNAVACNGINTAFTYDSANDPLGEAYSGGVLNGLAITNGYDTLLRRYNNVVLNGSAVLARTTNSYDADGRLAVMSDGTNTATYSYVANSPLVDHIVFAHSGSAVMTNQNTYDYVNRLTGKTSASSAASVYGVQPVYNTASQRTKVTLSDGSYWIYQYDALGQLTNGVKYFYDGTPYSGQQFQYGFDTIGNRTGTASGGDASGANLRVVSYTNNLLNQITSRGVPGYVDVMGLSLATNTVKVNGTNAYQKWEYYEEPMGTNNTSSAQWVGISVSAPGQTTISGHEFVAQTPENFGYDKDGNLTNDGHWAYYWDGENRLIAMSNNASIPAAGQYALTFVYDYLGRRIEKQVYTNSGSGYVTDYTNCFIYDGWNLAAIVNQNATLIASFVWGLDLSGSMQGAGGVGGLLEENLVGNGVQFVAYDGNGNVVALVSATNGTATANYEYGPFGEVIRATGPMAKLNPFRFSTKYQDDETDFLYYGCRYYNPSTGRWLSRDPLGELGGKNLYAFCINCPIDAIDPDGQDWLQDAANYSAGIADSLTFGLTGKAREGLIWMLFDEGGGGINTGSGAYLAGEVTEVTVEIAVTAGGASLRQTAKLAVRSELEGGARAAFRRANGLTGGFVHHANPILGHPGGAIARYPLPFQWAARGAWNMKWVPTRAAHMAEHANMLRLEALDEAREATMFVRQAGNSLANYMDSHASCSPWTVDISANVSGSSFQDGPIPETPSSMIEADVQISESGTEGGSGGE